MAFWPCFVGNRIHACHNTKALALAESRNLILVMDSKNSGQKSSFYCWFSPHRIPFDIAFAAVEHRLQVRSNKGFALAHVRTAYNSSKGTY